jgi:hypothetical protein
MLDGENRGNRIGRKKKESFSGEEQKREKKG